MKRVSVFLADGFEEIEALTVVDLLRRAKVYVDTVSITDEYTVRGAHGLPVQTEDLFDDRGELLFQKIPCGSLTIMWSGDFGFDITLYKVRREPEW